MKKLLLLLLAVPALFVSGCSDKEAKKDDPTFMFWCFRKEQVSDVYHIPEMKTQEAATYLRSRIKGVVGYVDSTVDLQANTMSITYNSSTIRKMNFEEAIAQAGFAVNNRPANPKAKVPAGLKTP